MTNEIPNLIASANSHNNLNHDLNLIELANLSNNSLSPIAKPIVGISVHSSNNNDNNSNPSFLHNGSTVVSNSVSMNNGIYDSINLSNLSTQTNNILTRITNQISSGLLNNNSNELVQGLHLIS